MGRSAGHMLMRLFVHFVGAAECTAEEWDSGGGRACVPQVAHVVDWHDPHDRGRDPQLCRLRLHRGHPRYAPWSALCCCLVRLPCRAGKYGTDLSDAAPYSRPSSSRRRSRSLARSGVHCALSVQSSSPSTVRKNRRRRPFQSSRNCSWLLGSSSTPVSYSSPVWD